MNSEDIPLEIAALAETAPCWINPSSTPRLLAHFWPAIEEHIREEIAQAIEQAIVRPQTSAPTLSAMDAAYRHAARIARSQTRIGR